MSQAADGVGENAHSWLRLYLDTRKVPLRPPLVWSGYILIPEPIVEANGKVIPFLGNNRSFPFSPDERLKPEFQGGKEFIL